MAQPPARTVRRLPVDPVREPPRLSTGERPAALNLPPFDPRHPFGYPRAALGTNITSLEREARRLANLGGARDPKGMVKEVERQMWGEPEESGLDPTGLEQRNMRVAQSALHNQVAALAEYKDLDRRFRSREFTDSERQAVRDFMNGKEAVLSQNARNLVAEYQRLHDMARWDFGSGHLGVRPSDPAEHAPVYESGHAVEIIRKDETLPSEQQIIERVPMRSWIQAVSEAKKRGPEWSVQVNRGKPSHLPAVDPSDDYPGQNNGEIPDWAAPGDILHPQDLDAVHWVYRKRIQAPLDNIRNILESRIADPVSGRPGLTVDQAQSRFDRIHRGAVGVHGMSPSEKLVNDAIGSAFALAGFPAGVAPVNPAGQAAYIINQITHVNSLTAFTEWFNRSSEYLPQMAVHTGVSHLPITWKKQTTPEGRFRMRAARIAVGLGGADPWGAGQNWALAPHRVGVGLGMDAGVDLATDAGIREGKRPLMMIRIDREAVARSVGIDLDRWRQSQLEMEAGTFGQPRVGQEAIDRWVQEKFAILQSSDAEIKRRMDIDEQSGLRPTYNQLYEERARELFGADNVKGRAEGVQERAQGLFGGHIVKPRGRGVNEMSPKELSRLYEEGWTPFDGQLGQHVWKMTNQYMYLPGIGFETNLRSRWPVGEQLLLTYSDPAARHRAHVYDLHTSGMIGVMTAMAALFKANRAGLIDGWTMTAEMRRYWSIKVALAGTAQADFAINAMRRGASALPYVPQLEDLTEEDLQKFWPGLLPALTARSPRSFFDAYGTWPSMDPDFLGRTRDDPSMAYMLADYAWSMAYGRPGMFRLPEVIYQLGTSQDPLDVLARSTGATRSIYGGVKGLLDQPYKGRGGTTWTDWHGRTPSSPMVIANAPEKPPGYTFNPFLKVPDISSPEEQAFFMWLALRTMDMADEALAPTLEAIKRGEAGGTTMGDLRELEPRYTPGDILGGQSAERSMLFGASREMERILPYAPEIPDSQGNVDRVAAWLKNLRRRGSVLDGALAAAGEDVADEIIARAVAQGTTAPEIGPNTPDAVMALREAVANVLDNHTMERIPNSVLDSRLPGGPLRFQPRGGVLRYEGKDQAAYKWTERNANNKIRSHNQSVTK